MKHFVILILLSALSRLVAGQERGQSDTARPETARRLQEVIIRGAKPPVQQNITGTVVNVQNGLFGKGNSVLDVLEHSPGITLDPRNNTISLNGRSGVTVMIDGKLVHLPEDELLAMMRGINADNIEKIELLTAPGARYDASGSAGVINIITKKNKRPGTTGAFSVNGGYGWGEKGGGSVNIDHNAGRLSWYGSYSFQHDHTHNWFQAVGSSYNPALGGPASFVFDATQSSISNNHNALLGLDTRLGHGWTAGVSVNYSNSSAGSANLNQGAYTLPPDSTLFFTGNIHGYSHWNNVIASFTADKDWNKGGKLGLGIDWLDYSNHRPSDVHGNFVTGHGATVGITNDSLFASENKGFSNTMIRVGVARLDYSVALNPRWRLEAGIKGDYTQSRSASGIQSLVDGNWVVSAAGANSIRMREGIEAGYAGVHGKLNDATTLDLGLRYEYSDTRLDDLASGAAIVKRQLGVLFPHLLLTRKAGENGQWQLSFTRRIARPSYKDLSSFVSYNDPFSVFTGNPLLQPTISNLGKMGYSWKGYSLAVVAGRDDHPIFRGAITPEPGSTLVYIRPENMAFQNNLGLELNLPFTVGNWWTMSYTFNGGWRQYRIGYLPLLADRTWFGYMVNIHENFRLPARFSAEISGWYRNTTYESTNRTRGIGEIDLGVKKELGKGSLQLTVTDLLRIINYKADVGAVGKDAFDTRVYISWNAESRRFPILRLTYTRSFGGGAAPDSKTERAGEERERIK